MIVDPDFFDHWRTRMLVDTIEDPQAPIYVMRIWAHCQQRKAWRFDSLPAAGLKALCRANGDAAALEQALISAGFIERDGDAIAVPKWAKHNAQLIAAWENGHRGGRPSKPKDSPSETQRLPDGNPKLTQTKPIREERIREDKTGEKKAPKVAAIAIALPVWVPADDWADFVKMRRAMRGVPFTDAAQLGVLRELEKLKGLGHEPAELLQLAVTSGWRTVYPPKGQAGSGARPHFNKQQALEDNNRRVGQEWAERKMRELQGDDHEAQ